MEPTVVLVSATGSIVPEISFLVVLDTYAIISNVSRLVLFNQFYPMGKIPAYTTLR